MAPGTRPQHDLDPDAVHSPEQRLYDPPAYSDSERKRARRNLLAKTSLANTAHLQHHSASHQQHHTGNRPPSTVAAWITGAPVRYPGNPSGKLALLALASGHT